MTKPQTPSGQAHGPDCCTHHPSCCGTCDECVRICWGYHGPERRVAPDDHATEQAAEAADAALAALAETVAGLPTLAVGVDWAKGEPNKSWTVWAVGLEAVLDAIATARKETK